MYIHLLMTTVVIALIALAAVPLISYVVEALRADPPSRRPSTGRRDIAARWIDVHGTSLRYVTAGNGPP